MKRKQRGFPPRCNFTSYLVLAACSLLSWIPATVRPDGSAPPQEPQAAHAEWLSTLSFSSTGEPVFLKANRLEFQYESRLLIYQGNVEVRQGEFTLGADEVRVVLSPGDQMEIQEVRAQGNVRLTQGTRWATAKEATFDQSKRVAILRGTAVLHDGRNEVRGETVTVYLDERRSVIDGGKGRVQAVLYPGTAGTRESLGKGSR